MLQSQSPSTAELAAYVGWHVDLEGRRRSDRPWAVQDSSPQRPRTHPLWHAISAMREHPLEVVSVGTGGDSFHAPRGRCTNPWTLPVPVVYYLHALYRGDHASPTPM